MTTFVRLLRLASPHSGWLALAALLTFLTLAAGVGLMALSAYLISKATLASEFASLAVAVTAVRSLAILRAASRYAERYVSHLVSLRILTQLRAWFYASVEPLAPAGLRTWRSGDLLSRIAADVETLDSFYVRVVLPPVAAGLVGALACLILGAFDVTLGLMLLAFLVFASIPLPLTAHLVTQRLSSELVEKRGTLTAALNDGLQGLADLSAFGVATRVHTHTLALSDELCRIQAKIANLRSLSRALMLLLAALAGVVILHEASRLATQGRDDGVFLALLPLTAIAAFEAVQPLLGATERLAETRTAGRRVFQLASQAPVVLDAPFPRPLPAQLDIEFRNVIFGYDAVAPVLHNVSFHVPSGGRALIQGPNGAGKSTVINLLLRFWEPQSGSILVGGHDIREYAAEDLRSAIGVVPQQPYLFNGSLRDNLLVAKGDATDEDLVAACRLAQLDDFLSTLPDGYDTLVGENGLKLSGGERQRLAVARAVLKDAPILILDEATANLDPTTARHLLDALDDFSRGRTVLFISHHADQLRDLDLVVELPLLEVQ